MTDAVMLQVRIDSSRLPGKALLCLGDLTVVEHAMRALLGVTSSLHLLLTDEESAPVLAPLAGKWGFTLFTGPKDDVLKRYALAVEAFQPDRLVRATGDNPLVSATLANQLLELQRKEGWDYCGFAGPPLGTGVEVIRSASLIEADGEARDPYEREHVAPFLYHRPERYRIARPEAPAEYSLPDLRLTLDTEEDYRFLQGLYNSCYQGDTLEIGEVTAWGRSRKSSQQGAFSA